MMNYLFVNIEYKNSLLALPYQGVRFMVDEYKKLS